MNYYEIKKKQTINGKLKDNVSMQIPFELKCVSLKMTNLMKPEIVLTFEVVIITDLR